MTESTCLICREDESNLVTRCGHWFHISCLNSWFEKNGKISYGTCPLCERTVSNVQLIEDLFSNMKTTEEKENIIKIFFEDSQNMQQHFREVCEWAVQNENTMILEKFLETEGVDDPNFFKDLDHLIVIAIKKGDLNIVKLLLSKNMDMSCSKLSVDVAVMYGNGNLEIVKRLKEKGFPCTPQAIESASQNGHLDVVKYLIETVRYVRSDIHKYLSEMDSSCSLHAINGYAVEKAARTLISKGRLCSSNAIRKASEYGHLNIVKYLIERDKPCSHNKAIESASENGHLDVVKYLVEMNQPCNFSFAVYCASRNGHLDVVKYLVGLRKLYPYDNAVNIASEFGHYDIVKYFIELGKSCTSDAIEWAAGNGHLDVVKYLIESDKPCTPRAFDKATQNGHLNVVKYFIESGKLISPNAINIAAYNGHLNIIKYLIDHGMSCTSKTMETAARNGNFYIVKYLVEVGCPYTLKTVEAVYQKGDLHIADYLDEHYREVEGSNTSTN